MSELTQLRNVNPQESRGYLSNEFLQSHHVFYLDIYRETPGARVEENVVIIAAFIKNDLARR